MLNLCKLASLWVVLCIAGTGSVGLASAELSVSAGPLWHEFDLTLAPGERTEAFGPFFYEQRKESERAWAVPPALSYTVDDETDFAEFDCFYPVLTYDRFGSDYRLQLLQLLSFSGGRTLSDTNVSRFTLFPLYFQQRSPIPDKNYTALFPVYGRLKNRLFRDEIDFVLFPLYAKTQRKGGGGPAAPDSFDALGARFLRYRKDAVTTYNFLYPVFHLRYGDQLRGWQAWPLVGHERKEPGFKTNLWDEADLVGGHDKWFAMWPLFFNEQRGLGTTNEERFHALLPFYSALRSPLRDSTTVLWPLGYTQTDDRARQFKEWGAPWPLVVFARGPGKTVNRVWPLYSDAHNTNLTSRFYLWPLYKYNRIHADPLDRARTRLGLFLYSDLEEKNTETGHSLHRTDAWPLWTWRRDLEGNTRLQVLSVLEPLMPNNKSIERDYSPLWSLWRSEKNAQTGARSQSLLWNLYRHEARPDAKKCSLLFGLFQYQSVPSGKRWRVFYVPFGASGPAAKPGPGGEVPK